MGLFKYQMVRRSLQIKKRVHTLHLVSKTQFNIILSTFGVPRYSRPKAALLFSYKLNFVYLSQRYQASDD